MPVVARLGDTSDHGGEIITAGSTVKANGILVARLGDQHSCPIPGHGVTPLVSASASVKSDGARLARVGDRAGCGATINSGSPNVKAGG